VNNDPVNWVDLWGLTASDKNFNNAPIVESVGITITVPRISKEESDKKLNNALADKAKEQLGPTNYVYGGKIPEIDGGLDCSGLADWSAEQVTGVKILDRTAHDQATDPKLTVPGDSSRGTLNYYDSDGDKVYEHVTINLGDGTEINPYGGKPNTKENPGPIKIMKNTEVKPPGTVINRQFNWDYILLE
jgi:cell wall-associated NlpC family hydrolase